MGDSEISVPRYDRSAWLVKAIEDWNAELAPEDRQTKYSKMAVSPYAMYRGTAHVFWADFAGDWRLSSFGNAYTRTWLEGDAHAYNLGAFYNHLGGVIYGFNDFDESIIADYQYDLWRLAVSIVLIARANGDLSGKKQKRAVDACAQAYLDTMNSFVGKRAKHKTFYFESKNTYGNLSRFLKGVKKDKGRRKMLKKWTTLVDGVRRFNLALEKLGEATEEEREAVLAAMPDYIKSLSGDRDYEQGQLKVKDVARRLLAGTGSLGTPRYYVLIEGEGSGQDDDRILDVKGQTKPTPYPFLSLAEQREYDRSFENDGMAHAAAYRALAYHPDDFLGWMRLFEGDYSVRERSPFKASYPALKEEAKSSKMKLTSEKRFTEIAAQWGIAYSEASRPPVPREGDHRFQSKATTDSRLKPTTWPVPVGRVVGLGRNRLVALLRTCLSEPIGVVLATRYPDLPRRSRCQRGNYRCERRARFSDCCGTWDLGCARPRAPARPATPPWWSTVPEPRRPGWTGRRWRRWTRRAWSRSCSLPRRRRRSDRSLSGARSISS